MIRQESAACHKLDAPGERQHGRGDAEGDHVGKRIHFAAEIADRICHARDAAIQPIQNHRDADGYGRDFEMRIAAEVVRPLPTKRLQWIADDSDEAEKNIASGEQSGQRIGGAARTTGRRARIEESLLPSEFCHGLDLLSGAQECWSRPRRAPRA